MMSRGKANKKVVQNLKDEKLRKIRYEFRTLLHLESEKRIKDLHDELVAISCNKSLSYNEYAEKTQPIVKNQERLRLAYSIYPLCCGICGDRMKNLVYNPVMYQWRCLLCYEQAHKNFPEDYP